MESRNKPLARKPDIVVTLLIIFLFGFGCNNAQSGKAIEIPKETNTKIPEAANTRITRAVLKERLGKKGIESLPVETFDEKKAAQPKPPNPLTLMLKFLEPGAAPKTTLNSQEYAYADLIKTLKAVFAEREKAGVFKRGTNEVEKEILLMASDADIEFYNSRKIYVEDFEKWIDDLRKEGIDQIRLDFNESEVSGIDFP
jgi:hypothetical protein